MKLFKDEPTTLNLNNLSNELISRFTYYGDLRISPEGMQEMLQKYADRHGIETSLDNLSKTFFHRPYPFLCRMDEIGIVLPELYHAKIRDHITELNKLSFKYIDQKVEREGEKLSRGEQMKENVKSYYRYVDEAVEGKSSFYKSLKKLNLGSRYVNELIKYIDDNKLPVTLTEDAEKWLAETKKERKPRAKKEKSAEEILKLFTYLKESNGRTSVAPESLIGAKTVLALHIPKKTLCVYNGKDMQVYRSTLKDYDPEKSFQVTIKSKELFEAGIKLKDSMSLTRFLNINSKLKRDSVSGRLGENYLLLGAWK